MDKIAWRESIREVGGEQNLGNNPHLHGGPTRIKWEIEKELSSKNIQEREMGKKVPSH